MKVHVVHDTNGNIKALMVPASGFTNAAGVNPNQGEQVTVVDHPDLEGQQLHQRLREINEQFRIDVSSGKLVKK